MRNFLDFGPESRRRTLGLGLFIFFSLHPLPIHQDAPCWLVCLSYSNCHIRHTNMLWNPYGIQVRSPSTMVTRVCYKHHLPRDLRSLIWANVERDYHSRGPVVGAATMLQAAWRRLRAIIQMCNPNLDTCHLHLHVRHDIYRQKRTEYAATM